MTPRHLFRRSLGHDAPAVLAALRPQIHNPVSIADHVHIVLDDDDAVAQVRQPVQHFQQLADIVKMQSRSRLIEQVKRLARSAAC